MVELSLRTSLERMRDIGFQPQTIFDVGVATGTTGLYKVFHGVAYMLVDPLEESEPFMREICERMKRGTYVVAAAAAEPGELTIAVHPGLSGSGQFLKGDFPKRKVKAVTLDQLVDEHQLEGPFLLKIDVQGAELNVLEGLRRHVDKAEAIVVEVSLWADRKKRGTPTFAEMIAYMSGRGFVLYDITNIAYRQRDGAPAELDIIFCRHDSALREHSTYRTPDQFKAAYDQKRDKFAESAKPQL